jgi:hypothetical protein
MDLFRAAFGSFSPLKDSDAAVKICLHSIAADNHLDTLQELLTEGAELGGMEGVPGWSLERRDSGDTAPVYAGWPAGAKFRAFVDPEALALAVPERFYSWSEFLPFLRAIVQAYAVERPGQAAHCTPLLALINEDAAAA